MIGDKLIDLQCGWNAGIKASILVRTGYGAEQTCTADWICDDAIAAVGIILNATRPNPSTR